MKYHNKMKYHKIKGVALETCTAEQFAAYNLARVHHDTLKKVYDAEPTQLQKSGIVRVGVNFCIERWRLECAQNSQCNINAIFYALNAGLENFLQKDRPGFWSYAEIGQAFPAQYLEK